MHIFGSERGALATPARCGTYPVHSTFVPWDSAFPTQSSTQYFTIDSGPYGTPCPGAHTPFSPALRGRLGRQHRRCPHAVRGRSDPRRRRSEPDRADGDDAARLRRDAEGSPLLPRAADAGSPAAYSGLAELASPACPPASQIGTAVAGAGAGPTRSTSRQGLPGRPLQARRSASLAVIPGGLGAIRPRQRRGPRGAPRRPRHRAGHAISDPLPQILEGSRCGPARQGRARPPGLHAQPDQLRSFAVEATVSGDEGGDRQSVPHFQMANCADLPFGPKLALRLSRRDPASQESGAPRCLDGPSRRSQHRPSRRPSAPLGVSRQRPRTEPLQDRGVRGRRMPRRIPDRTRDRRKPPDRKAA